MEMLVTTFRVPPDQLVALGVGEEQPADPANPDAAINRRVSFRQGTFPTAFPNGPDGAEGTEEGDPTGRTLTTSLVEPVGTDGHEVTGFVVGSLQSRDPDQGFQSGLPHGRFGNSGAECEHRASAPHARTHRAGQCAGNEMLSVQAGCDAATGVNALPDQIDSHVRKMGMAGFNRVAPSRWPGPFHAWLPSTSARFSPG